MIPLQPAMNMDDPAEHLLWALVNPCGKVGAPLLLHPEAMREISEHIYNCGFRHHPEHQQIFYLPPREDASTWEALAGRWVSKADYDADAHVAAAAAAEDDYLNQLPAALSPQQARKLRDALTEKVGETP